MGLKENMRREIQRAEAQVSEARKGLNVIKSMADADLIRTPVEQTQINEYEDSLQDLVDALAVLKDAYRREFGAL